MKHTRLSSLLADSRSYVSDDLTSHWRQIAWVILVLGAVELLELESRRRLPPGISFLTPMLRTTALLISSDHCTEPAQLRVLRRCVRARLPRQVRA